ncbi:MAG: hypothetical protein EAX96_07730 [Candidatus Lokiarchaeota archaeon]|nr:hypothetical protein [Candidatus Lokiarchaeota archaeon]
MISMKSKKILILFLFLSFFLSSFILIPLSASPNYGIKNGSQYQWLINENTHQGMVQSNLIATFNMKTNMVQISKTFNSNGSRIQYNLAIESFNKCIVDLNTRNGRLNFFYTGKGAMYFPRNVIITELNSETKISDYDSGIVLYYKSNNEEYTLISGEISITWFIWVILTITISLSLLSVFLIYKRLKKPSPVLVYGINQK